MNKGMPRRLSTDFSAKNSAGKMGMTQYISGDERKYLQSRILYLARHSFRFDGEIKSFIDKQKLKEFSTTKPRD